MTTAKLTASALGHRTQIQVEPDKGGVCVTINHDNTLHFLRMSHKETGLFGEKIMYAIASPEDTRGYMGTISRTDVMVEGLFSADRATMHVTVTLNTNNTLGIAHLTMTEAAALVGALAYGLAGYATGKGPVS